MNVSAIDHHMNVSCDHGGRFVKCVRTQGAPGSGKSFTSLYSCLYVIGKGLKVIATSMLYRRSVHLGGTHIHKLFSLPVNNSLSPQRMVELVILKLLRNPVKHNVLQTINIIFIDEVGQVSAELLSVLDMILRRL